MLPSRAPFCGGDLGPCRAEGPGLLRGPRIHGAPCSCMRRMPRTFREPSVRRGFGRMVGCQGSAETRRGQASPCGCRVGLELPRFGGGLPLPRSVLWILYQWRTIPGRPTLERRQPPHRVARRLHLGDHHQDLRRQARHRSRWTLLDDRLLLLSLLQGAQQPLGLLDVPAGVDVLRIDVEHGAPLDDRLGELLFPVQAHAGAVVLLDDPRPRLL